MTAILGISAFYHDSAAALVIDGNIVAAAQEERFTRKKHDASFPRQAIDHCLATAGLTPADLDHVGFYEKPLLKFDRLLETYLSFAPQGFWSFRKAMPEWSATKLQLRREIRRGLGGQYRGRICFCEHHQSHAASAFYPSPFDQAAVLTMDGVGEWATTSLGHGAGNRIELTDEIRFPHSLGLLYSALTYYCGFEVNSGEYKLMGLAPFGQPQYVDVILDQLVTLHEDGSYHLNMQYFNYCQGLTMTSRRFDRLFGRRPRQLDQPIETLDMDLAASIQRVTEMIVLKTAQHLHAKTKATNLCLAGGVALNCVANGRLLREGPFENLWVQPAAGDAGGALGVALLIWHQLMDKPRSVRVPDGQSASLLGPAVDRTELVEYLDRQGAVYQRIDDPQTLDETVAQALADGNVIGRVAGRMEFGPRALGNRSILADARNTEMQSVLNLKIKFRESFRPFAPIVLAERAAEYFDLRGDQTSPYMLIVSNVLPSQRVAPLPTANEGLARVREVRSTIPAVTHLDGTARIQTVDDRNPELRRLLETFASRTGCPVLVNTSFNVRDEPIVCTAADAFRCFMKTEMDLLVIENYVLRKQDQSAVDGGSWAAPAADDPDAMTPRQLGWFCVSLTAMLLMVAGILHSRWQLTGAAGVLVALAAVVAVLAAAVPSSRRQLHRAFMAVTFPLRFLLTLVVLAIVYFAVLTPIGVTRRLLGHDLRTVQDPTSGWVPRQPRSLESYFDTY